MQHDAGEDGQGEHARELVTDRAVFCVVGPALDDIDAATIVYVVASLTVVRMLPTAISLIGSGEPPLAVGFLGWFGPRGLASIALGLQALLDRSPSVMAGTAGR